LKAPSFRGKEEIGYNVLVDVFRLLINYIENFERVFLNRHRSGSVVLEGTDMNTHLAPLFIYDFIQIHLSCVRKQEEIEEKDA
jgi:hypothetical protein